MISKQLSTHFNLHEVEKSNTALRLGISNKLPEKYYKFAQDLALNILEPCRTEFGPINPNSWFRGKDLNNAIGGSSTSQHCKGQAVDIEVTKISNTMLGQWIYNNLKFDQLIFEYISKTNPKNGWIHCSYVDGKNRNQVLQAYKKDGKTRYKKLSDKQIKAL